jgi:hypothetical protein
MELTKAIKIAKGLMESPDIPMIQYNLEIIKNNGEHQVTIHKRDCSLCIENMECFSPILNNHCQAWHVKTIGNILYIIAD